MSCTGAASPSPSRCWSCGTGGWTAAAERRASKTLAKLNTHEMESIGAPNFKALAYAVAFGSIVLTAGLWILNDGSLDAG